MTSQMEADRLLAEHRAVMAILVKECVGRPTQEEYDRTLSRVSEEMSCQPTTGFASLSPSQGASL